MAGQGDSIAAFDVQRGLAEFADLNRRRLFGAPPLEVRELERWLELRACLESHFGSAGSNDWTGLERRQFLRLPTHIRIEIGSGANLQAATVKDVSQGGLFIALQRPLDVGSRVSLTLAPPDGMEPIEVTGRVAWIRPARSGGQPAGMGVEFDRQGERQRELIRQWIERAASDGKRDA
jgi:uncharacterized protein (TIGR02266 family)